MKAKRSTKDTGTDTCLVIGIGNDSRQDDGLGWALLDMIEKNMSRDQAELVYRYQLNIEDADLIRDAKRILFVDACYDEDLDGSILEPCNPNGDITFTTHALSPAAVLALCEQVYGEQPDAYVLKMKGYAWELKRGLTPGARRNLKKGYELFCDFLKHEEEE